MTPPQQALSDVVAKPALSRFWSGVCFAASGIPTTLSSPRLTLLALIPIAVQTAIFVGLVMWGISLHDDAVAWTGLSGDGWLATMVRGLVEALLYVLIVVVGLVLTIFVGSIVLDPFYDLLSEEAERRLCGRTFGDPFTLAGVVPGVLRELFATAVRLAIYFPVAILIWTLGFVPVVGQIAAAPLGLSWTWLFVCYEVVVRSLARHGLPPRGRLDVLFDHKALALGFGAGAWLALFLPFLAPFLVVGGTKLYLVLAAHDRVPSRLDDATKGRLTGRLEGIP